jgi:dTDP-L-rhamnose 4-epimerase
MNFVPSSRTIDQLKKLDWECKGPNGETLTLKPTSEESYTLPCSIYAATKLACEQMAGIVSEAYGIPIVCLRFQNVYGEGQSLKNPYTGIISIFSNRLRNNQSINIFEDGEESRDFIHVSDVVESIRLSLESTMKGFPILNIGSGIPTSVMAVASILKEKLNSQSEIRVSGDFRVGDIRHCYADMTRVVKILNFQPKIGIEQGLGFFCDWFIKQSPETDRSDDALKELANKGLARK